MKISIESLVVFLKWKHDLILVCLIVSVVPTEQTEEQKFKIQNLIPQLFTFLWVSHRKKVTTQPRK